jgi:non-reducing end alpha-L-arabinofuranosidase
MAALTLTLMGATLVIAQQTGREAIGAPPRPQGPCDVYAAGGTPCVAAHSSIRALYASYAGPLYQVLRHSDGKTLDIGVVKPSVSPVPDSGGYADAAAQDAFCANTYCWIIKLYDQSGKGNHLVQAPRGGFSGPAMGGFNNVPVADLAPITIMGHKAYGVFIEPGMGLRWNDAHGTAVDDQAEGQYWVIDGHHYNSGCCFDYGNAETDSRDDGNGTMETTYYGNASAWYRGPVPGPWIMTDQENNLVGCVTAEGNNKYCAELPNITWRFVTAMAKGEPHHWTSLGGNSQTGSLAIMFNGKRVDASYDPMRKQGGILLGNGGDNSVGSQGTFYEGAMTAAGTFPTDATDQKVQANIVAAKYDVAQLSVAPASAVAMPPGLQTFSPLSSQDTTVTFRNITGAPVSGLRLNLSVPVGWTAVASVPASFTSAIAPGASVSETFKVTSGQAAFNGDLVAKASWTVNDVPRTESAIEKVRNVNSVKINEFRISAGANSTDSFIELYNAGNSTVDISNWTLTHHPAQLPIFSAVKIPAGTSLGAKRFYLLGLSASGLAVSAAAGENTIYVRSTTGMNVGDTITIGSGPGTETRKIASLGTPASTPLTLWQPLPDGPVLTIPAGSTNAPFAAPGGARGSNVPTGFVVGEKIALGHGATYPAVSGSIEKYEVVTVTAVGKPGTQAWLTAPAKAGETNLKVSSVANLTAGDQIRLDIDSVGHGIETVTVKSVGTQSARNAFKGKLNPEELGTGLELTVPLRFNHSSNISFSSRGTGITFTPKTSFAHSSNEPITPLGSGLKLDRPLANAHEIDAVVGDAAVTTAGYQQAPKPNQWFGGPALGPNAGNMVLRDAGDRVVDSLNFGGVVDPWAAEGYQALSGAGANGCSVASPRADSRGGVGNGAAQPTVLPNRSSGRFPDGVDTDSNCNDFELQAATTMEAASAVGSNNLKVANISDFAAGQTIVIDTGVNQETAIIATVGTQGAATVETATAVGATVIPISGVAAFVPGQTVIIDSGANQEVTVVISGVARNRGGFGNVGGQGAGPSITISAPLTRAHAVGAEIAGTGITVMGGLTKAHDRGAQVVNGVPTPGAPNQYSKR